MKGVKIAIDPGHLGGAFAKLEEKYVMIPPEESQLEKSISFDEGTLTYLTALELQSLLQQEGAEVLMTRSGIGQGVMKETFFEWLGKQPALWENKESLTSLFTYYNRADLIARAEKINAFSPDITVVIHYNADDSKGTKNSNTQLVKADYNLAFIPGAFCAGELNSIDDRYEFLRLIVTDNLEKSLKLSQIIVSQFTKKLQIPLVNENTTYLKNSCLLQEVGIYSRNLALTRLIHSPLCYGETLIQNSVKEFRRLATNDATVDGIPCSSRVKEVACAYFEGIKIYFRPNNQGS